MNSVVRKSRFALYLELSKVRITIAVSFTTITGYVLGKGFFDFGFFGTILGIFLLACGASVINHLQEHKTDRTMARTKNRPIPSGKISKREALLLATFEIFIGSAFLFYGARLFGLVLGIFALGWYNLIYTNLKKITVHAVIPGSLIGAIPPLVGWVAAEQSLFSMKAITMALFFFVWQVPHFYLLALKYGKEYEDAGLASLTAKLSVRDIKYLIFIWLLLTVLCSVILYMTQVVRSKITLFGIILGGVWIIGEFSFYMYKTEDFSPGKYFIRINYYVLLIVILLNLDYIFNKFIQF